MASIPWRRCRLSRSLLASGTAAHQPGPITQQEEEALIVAASYSGPPSPRSTQRCRIIRSILIQPHAATASVTCNCCIAASSRRSKSSAFESAQILQLDHGFNASTFTARVVTSTLAPATSALLAAMGARYMDRCMAPPISKHWRWRWKLLSLNARSAFVAQCLPPGAR